MLFSSLEAFIIWSKVTTSSFFSVLAAKLPLDKEVVWSGQNEFVEPEKMFKKLKTEIKRNIEDLEKLSSEQRIELRTEKFSNIGN